MENSLKYVFLGKNLMFVLGYFRKNDICGVKMVTGIDRRTSTFCCSCETGDLWLKHFQNGAGNLEFLRSI